MPIADDNVRVSVTLSREAYEQLRAFANRFNHTDSKMAGNFIVIGMEALSAYDKWIMKPETSLSLSVTMDSVCSALGLPSIFKTTDTDRQLLKELRARRKSVRDGRNRQ